jgi:hypothetical protein
MTTNELHEQMVDFADEALVDRKGPVIAIAMVGGDPSVPPDVMALAAKDGKIVDLLTDANPEAVEAILASFRQVIATVAGRQKIKISGAALRRSLHR